VPDKQAPTRPSSSFSPGSASWSTTPSSMLLAAERRGRSRAGDRGRRERHRNRQPDPQRGELKRGGHSDPPAGPVPA
jgi:hypothetical protein